MRTTILLLFFAAAPLAAQPRLELAYGIERNVASSEPEYDGWLGTHVAWMVRPGWSLGIGADHHFENRRPGVSDYQGLAVFASLGRSWDLGEVSPYARVGLGAGRAPCQGDTCGDGLYLRAAAGLRARLAGPFELTAEIGVSRVGRPLAGAGMSYRPGP